MKKWVKKLRSIALVALITVALSGKAYAEGEEETVPDTPPQFIAPAALPLSNTDDPDTPANEVSAATETDTSEFGGTLLTSASADQDDDDADAASSTTDGTPSTTDGIPSATDGTPTTADSTMAVDGVGISDMIDGTPADPDDPSLITDNGLTDDILMLGAGAPMDTTDPNAMDGSEDGTVQNRDGASDSSLQQLNENIYALVNHNGPDTSLHSDGEIVVLAAGVNVIDSISGETIIFAGSGILIVNSLEGERSFQTLIDIYDQGSVAVFVKSGENEYTLINGGVPGILDEDYLIEGYTLIMPDQSQLLICGTGVSLKDKEGNESVNYYHGTNHEYPSSFSLTEEEVQNYIEYTGNLTIGNGASLVVEKGAAITVENLRSVGQTDSYDFTRYPTITVTDGGNLTIENGGIITGGGDLTLSEQGTLTGGGTVQTSKVYIDGPENVAGFQGLFVGLDGKLTIIYLKGTGTYSNLSFSNCTVDMTEGQADLSGVSTSGGTVFLLKGGEDLEIDSVDGNLSVRSRGYTYNDNITVSGNIGGTGTISFDCGIYHLAEGLTLNGASINQNSGAVIIDHAGVLETSKNLIHIDPDDVTPSSQSGYYIPAVCAALSVHPEPNQLEWIEVRGTSFIENSVLIGSYPGIIYPQDLLSLINEYRGQSEYANYLGYVYLLHYQDGKYWLQEFREYDLNNNQSGSGIEQVDLTDVCLIQVQLRNDTHYTLPAGTATQTNTAYTGSGILGGAGAGSVHYGTSTNNDNGNGNNNNNGNGSNNDNGSGNSQEGNQNTASVQTGGETNLSFWIEQVIIGKQYVLHAVDGEKTLREFGGKVKVVIHLELPHEDAGKTMYAVFRTADGTLKAFQISYSILKSELVFVADTLGEFVLVAFDFEGEEFSKEFYEALEQIVEI